MMAEGFQGEGSQGDSRSLSSSCKKAFRILMAEDSLDNRLLVQALLQDTPHAIEVAENGQIAINMFMRARYDVILMDIHMPVVDGYMATRTIRSWEQYKNLSRTPVIAFTASLGVDAASRSLAAGCDMHLTKPVSRDRLLAAIRSLACSCGAAC